MEKPATDIYTFEDLRKKGFTYVDKTDIIWPLVNESIGKQFFMARPRRFGKSLLVSTLHALFEGRRDLFEGLAIEPKWDWTKTWPVLHLDMGSCQAETVEGLWRKIREMLEGEAERLKMPLRKTESVSGQFRFLIDDLAARNREEIVAAAKAKEQEPPDDPGQMVLLVDEYDKPLLGHLSKPDVTQFKDALKEFYSIIKTLEGKQRFAFITGVSKFSKVSIFSDLNNLKDRTMTPGEATLLGYTHDELKKFFPETLAKIGRANGLDADGAFDKVVRWYGGYRFAIGSDAVINPISFGCLAQQLEFKLYWTHTTSLLEVAWNELAVKPLDFSRIPLTVQIAEGYSPQVIDLIALLYQIGYLTLSPTTSVESLCHLIFPNYEVEEQFFSRAAQIYSGCVDIFGSDPLTLALKGLWDGNVNGFIKVMRAVFANIPYNLTDRQNEQMWQTIVYVVLKAIGVAVHAEVMTNEGRIDMTCETPAAIWLIEFKLDHSADEALEQIEKNGYATKFDLSSKRVIKIGIAFSSEQRTITDVKIG